MQADSRAQSVVAAIRLLHTAVWLFFVFCIAGIPVAATLHRFRLAALFGVLVLLECFVLAANRFRCPLTDLAARFTPETAENFDIYLPNWLARHNKTIFGTLFAAGSLYALAQWLLARR